MPSNLRFCKQDPISGRWVPENIFVRKGKVKHDSFTWHYCCTNGSLNGYRKISFCHTYMYANESNIAIFLKRARVVALSRITWLWVICYNVSRKNTLRLTQLLWHVSDTVWSVNGGHWVTNSIDCRLWSWCYICLNIMSLASIWLPWECVCCNVFVSWEKTVLFSSIVSTMHLKCSGNS